MTTPDSKPRATFSLLLLWLASLLLFCLMAYGGVRTPDGEVVFRVGESLAERGTFAVEKDLEAWPDFGLPRGVDGRRYAGFAPAQSILLAPFIRVASRFNQTRWYEYRRIPISFAADAHAFRSYILRQRPADMEPHAPRFLVSFLIPLVASLVVVLQFLIIRRLTGNPVAAFITALLLALATPLWHYSGTMFAEPLAMVFVLLSFYLISPRRDLNTFPVSGKATRFLGSGLLLGLAFTTHITAILMTPFFLVIAISPWARSKTGLWESRWTCARVTAGFIAGTGIMALLYGTYNYMRFGNPFELGRQTAEGVAYGVFTTPWEGLAGLLASPGKGIFWFCPILIAAVFWWPHLHKRYRYLSFVIIAMVLFRLFFIAFRSDWHGGFCLGPRYFLMVLPFLLIAIGCRLADFFAGDRPPGLWRPFAAGAFLFACAVQQIYFCLGEPISFYYMLRMVNLQQGISIIANNQIYFQWSASPLMSLFDGRRGPFLLQSVPLGQWELLAACALAMALVTGFLTFYLILAKRKRYT